MSSLIHVPNEFEPAGATVLVVRLTVLLIIGWSVQKLLRTENPRWRILLWRATAIGLVLAVLFSLGLPTVTWQLLPASANFDSNVPSNQNLLPRQAAIDLPPTSNDAPASLTTSSVSQSGLEGRVGTQTATPQAVAELGIDDSKVLLPDHGSRRRLDSEAWLFVIWLGGVGVVLHRSRIGARRVRRIVAEAAQAPTQALSLARDVAIKCNAPERSFDVRLSEWSAAPCLTGVLHPVILIPTNLVTDGEDGRLCACLAHELAHLAGRDLVWNALLHSVAAALWFHPLAWRLRTLHEDACDQRCDAVAAGIVGDVQSYCRYLAQLAVQNASESGVCVLPMARRAQVLERIALLPQMKGGAQLPIRRATAMTIVYAIVACVVAMVSIGRKEAIASGPSSEAIETAQLNEVEADNQIAADDAEQRPTRALEAQLPDVLDPSAITELRDSIASIRTAHFRLRRFHQGSQFFRGGTSPADLADLIVTHDIGHHPENLTKVLDDAADVANLPNPPWGRVKLHILLADDKQPHIRESSTWLGSDDGDVHVQTGDVAIRWDAANSQMNIMPRRDDHLAITSLADVLPQNGLTKLDELKLDSAQRATHRGKPVFVARNPDGQATCFFEPENGLPTELVLMNGTQEVREQWLGWKRRFGVFVPTITTRIVSRNGVIQRVSILYVDLAQFNTPLPEFVFQLGAPAGSTIVDERGEFRSIRIQRDVFDVTSQADLEAASTPLRDELTETEQRAVNELRRTYVLSDGEILKRFGPPFPLSRNYLCRMIQPAAGPNRREFSYFLEWRDDRPTYYFGIEGTAPKLGDLISYILKQPSVDVDIDEGLLNASLPGDYMFRSEATREQLAQAISRVLCDELGRSVSLVFQEVERPVYIASGTLAIDVQKTSRQTINGQHRNVVALNSGPYSGDHGEQIGFGDLSRLLSEIGEYIGVKILNEVAPSSEQLTWSKRWYDLKNVPMQKRFRIDPDAVLKTVTAQTGVEFEKSTTRVSILRLHDN